MGGRARINLLVAATTSLVLLALLGPLGLLLRRSAEERAVVAASARAQSVAALVAGCDGTHPLGELAAVLELAYGIEPGQVEEMARGLTDRGFLIPTRSVG